MSHAVYGSRWYDASIQLKKLIGFVLMRSQKAFVVYSGFYVANLLTFTSVGFIDLSIDSHKNNLLLQILSAAASYITILQSLQNGN